MLLNRLEQFGLVSYLTIRDKDHLSQPIGFFFFLLQGFPDACMHLSIYSPPFGGLYHYSSHDRDLSNCDDYETFLEQYAFVVRELNRVTLPGRITAVH